MQDDALLLRRAQKGDPEAFEALIAPYEKRIYGLCLRMLGNREDALDCAQDAMLRIWRGMGSFRMKSSLSTWCYRIATNACLDFLRRQKVRPSVSLDMLSELGFMPAGESEDPVHQAEEGARRQALMDGIGQLAPDQRAALILRDVQGLSYEEVADVLQLALGTVKSRISRAREKLRGILYQQGELFDAQAVYTAERRVDA